MYIRVKSCCFGCSSLEQGSKAIAIIGLVFSVVGLVLNALALDIGSIVTHVISIVISYLLLHGVKNRKTGYIVAWLVLEMIGIVLLTVFVALLLLLFLLVDGGEEKFNQTVVELIPPLSHLGMAMSRILIGSTIVYIVICLYCFVVVYSHYKKLYEELYGSGEQVLQPIGAVEEGVVGYGKEDASACAGAGATTIRSTGYEHQSPPPPYDRKA